MSAPFGIELYSPIHGYEVVTDIGQLKYAIIAPKPHPVFTSYIVQATPTLGIVWVKGNSDFRSVDAFGNTLRTEVDRIADQLALKYGRGRKTDFILSGALWMSLNTG